MTPHGAESIYCRQGMALRVGRCIHGLSRVRLWSAALLVWTGLAMVAGAQSAPATGGASQPGESNSRAATDSNSTGYGSSGSTAFENSDLSGRGSGSSQAVLPGGQIVAILEENPEAVVEVKSLVADALRQKGLAVQADA